MDPDQNFDNLCENKFEEISFENSDHKEETKQDKH